MRFLRTLGSRLTFAYASALFIGLCAFAVASGISLERLSEAAFDARIRSAASAAAVTAADSLPGLHLDRNDINQFDRVVTARLDGALVRFDGSIATTTAAQIPPEILRYAPAAEAESEMRTFEWRGETIRVAMDPVKQHGRISGVAAVWASTEPLADFRQLVVTVFGIAIPAIVALAAIAGGFVTRRGLAPLRDIATLAGDIEAHDLSKRLRPRSTDELGSLSATFDRMLDRLQAAFERQRQFTADASHELRAPLSVIRAEADLALRRQRDAGEYRTALGSIADEADRIEALIGDLLALARAESGPPHEPSTVDVGALVADAAERMRVVAAARGVRIETDVADGILVRGDAGALSRVPLALLHNAVKYARDNGLVRARLSRDGLRYARLVVADDGAGFSDEGLKFATERFWRDDAVRGRSGSGLGLAIVRAIVEQSEGSIEVRNSAEGGAEVAVRLPSVER